MLKIKKKTVIRYAGREKVGLPGDIIDVKKEFKLEDREAELLEYRYSAKMKGCVEIVDKKEEIKKEKKEAPKEETTKEKAKVNDSPNVSRQYSNTNRGR